MTRDKDPEDTIDGPKPGPRSSVNEALKRVAQRNVLGDEICSMLENGSNNGENQRDLERHLAHDSLSPNDREKSATPPLYPIMTRHTPGSWALPTSARALHVVRSRCRDGAHTSQDGHESGEEGR